MSDENKQAGFRPTDTAETEKLDWVEASNRAERNGTSAARETLKDDVSKADPKTLPAELRAALREREEAEAASLAANHKIERGILQHETFLHEREMVSTLEREISDAEGFLQS